MKTFKILSFLSLIILSFGSVAQNASEAKVKELFEIMQNKQQFESMMDGMIEMQKDLFNEKGLDDTIWPETKEMIKAFSYDDLAGLVVPIYQKHLSESDVDAMITFYKSEAGQHFIEKMPLITMESMKASMSLSEIIMKNFNKKMDELKKE